VAVAKFVRLPALAQGVWHPACPVLRFIGKTGCFVEGTLVVVGEEWVAVVLPAEEVLADLASTAPAAKDDAADWDQPYLVLLVGTLGLTGAGWLLLKRCQRRSAEDLAAADEVWLDSEDWLDGKDADWEAMLASWPATPTCA